MPLANGRMAFAMIHTVDLVLCPRALLCEPGFPGFADFQDFPYPGIYDARLCLLLIRSRKSKNQNPHNPENPGSDK